MKLPFELFLALRYLKPKREFVWVITLLSLVGVLLGVGVLVLVISVFRGFERDIREKVIGFTAHVTVLNYGILNDADALYPKIEALAGVRAVSPFVGGPVLVEFRQRISTPFVRGIDPAREDKALGLARFIVEGEFLLEGEAVLVGQGFADRNGVRVGDKLMVFSPRHFEEMRKAAEQGQKVAFLPTELLVTGVFNTGYGVYDENFILTSLEMAQHMYNIEEGVHGIAVRLDDPMRAEATRDAINAFLERPAQAQTWMDLNRQLFGAIATERNVMFFLLVFIIIVAGFGLTSTLITLTVQKSREIGLAKALGATEGQVLRVFVLYGLVVGVVGTALGLASGLLLTHFRNQAASLLAKVLGVEIFPYEIYHFAEIPADIHWDSVAIIAISAVVICGVAALLPAWRAARLAPARALRYE